MDYFVNYRSNLNQDIDVKTVLDEYDLDNDIDDLEENYIEVGDEIEIEEGKKDACYHKVKARYSVWPSAYASGALVKCRKKGAANWGNKTKKESFEFGNWKDNYVPTEYESIDIIKPEPLKPTPSIIDEAGL